MSGAPPKIDPSPAAEGHDGHGGAGKPSSALKLKLAALKGKIKERLPTLPKVDGAALKAGAKAFLKDVVTLPMLLWTGDTPTRMAVVGFVLSATLLVITAPQVLQVLFRAAPGLKNIPGLAQVETAPKVVAEPKPAPLKTLGPVAYMGELQGSFEGGGTYALEVFLEFESEEEATAARGLEEKTRTALLATLSKLTQEDWVSPEGKRESLVALAAAAGEAVGVKPQRILVTKEALTEREPHVE
jgi:hypothetical protein